MQIVHANPEYPVSRFSMNSRNVLRVETEMFLKHFIRPPEVGGADWETMYRTQFERYTGVSVICGFQNFKICYFKNVFLQKT